MEAAARTLRYQGAANRLVRALLHLPVLGRALGARLATIYVVGRVSGRRYAVPVAYHRRGGELLVGSQFRWIRNLRTGEQVELRLAGRRRVADVQVLDGEGDVTANLALMARHNHRFARFNGIRLDARGEPAPEDLHGAWTAGARVAVLSPR